MKTGLFACGVSLLVAMSIAAHTAPYMPGDVAISRLVQADQSGWLDTVTAAVSWPGFPPQSNVLFGLIALALVVFGHRWAAVIEIVAAIGAGGLYLFLQRLVGQPRPSADLIQVAGSLEFGAFPSGHLATFVAVFGFLAFLGYRGLRPAASRWAPVGLVGVYLLLLSFARLYAGQHWASDVLAGWLLGGLWLAVCVRIYT